ncbi:MAG: hypothetical protein ACRDCA_03420, partial [Serratia sp. (in: enterobacteria)]
NVEAGELLLAGGTVQVNGGQATVTLPGYRYTPTPATDNSYRVAVTAADVKDNHSNRELTTVVVQAPQVQVTESSITGVIINRRTFAASAGLPNIGFKGAHFQLLIDDTVPAADDWAFSSDASWASVNNTGEVSLGDGGIMRATIKVIRKSDGLTLTYSFGIYSWLVNNGSTPMPFEQARGYCRSISSYYWLPVDGDLQRLVDQWGDMSKYPTWFGGAYWSSTANDTQAVVVILKNGKTELISKSMHVGVVCVRQGASL